MAIGNSVLGINNLKDFNGIDGLFVQTTPSGDICDVILPPTYNQVEKITTEGKLLKLEYYDEQGNHYTFEN